jgi:hypothetical protein
MVGWGVAEFAAWIAWWVSGFWGFLVVALAILVFLLASEVGRVKRKP